jgi:acyl carrier protein
MTHIEFWNRKSVAEREKFILEAKAKTGLNIGITNAKNRFEKITNGLLLSLIEKVAKGSENLEEKRKSILKNVKRVLREKYEIEDVDSADSFRSMPLDSLNYVELIMEMEKEYGISIGDEEIIELKTVADFVKCIFNHTEKISDSKETEPEEEKLSHTIFKSETLEELSREFEGEAEMSASDELDLCISFDDTGSMYTVRSQVRSNINSLIDRLFDDIPNLRIGIIIHNDYCDMPRHIFVQDFTNDKTKIKNFVNQDSPCGGGDAPECYELALHEASKLSWRADRRALVMIGDEVPHHVGYRYGSHTNNLDWKVETEALRAMDVKVYGVQALGRRSSTHFYDAISRMTGGIKLDLSQFQHIPTYINAIAYHQSGQLETYRSSDPSFNTNFALRNMFSKLSGGISTLDPEKIEILSKFQVLKVETDGEMSIRDFVETNGLTFRKGKGYYQLIERTSDGKANSEIVQSDKEVLFVDKFTGETVADTHWCREKLGVPYGTKATVRPLSIPDVMSKYDIFIQSNSVNRKLDPGCKFLYELDHH